MPVEFRPDPESIVRLTEGRLSNHPDTYGYYWLDGRRIEHTSILEFRDDDGTWFPVMAMHVRYVYGCLLELEILPNGDEEGGDTISYGQEHAERLRWPTEVPAAWLRTDAEGGPWWLAQDGGWNADFWGVPVVVDPSAGAFHFVTGLGPGIVTGQADTLEQAKRDAVWAAMHWQSPDTPTEVVYTEEDAGEEDEPDEYEEYEEEQ